MKDKNKIETEKDIKLRINIPTTKKGDENTENVFIANPFAKNQFINFCKTDSENIPVDPIGEDREITFNESDYIAPQRLLAPVKSDLLPSQEVTNVNQLVVEKSLKTSVIFESNLSISFLKTKLSDSNFVIQKMKDFGKDNLSFYYRYPDTNLPPNQKKNIHKAFSSSLGKLDKKDENIAWYKMFSEKWRKALLSTYETFKLGLVNCFYFVQENMTILFERDAYDFTLKAYMQLSSLALAEDLGNNGILFIRENSI